MGYRQEPILDRAKITNRLDSLVTDANKPVPFRQRRLGLCRNVPDGLVPRTLAGDAQPLHERSLVAHTGVVLLPPSSRRNPTRLPLRCLGSKIHDSGYFQSLVLGGTKHIHGVVHEPDGLFTKLPQLAHTGGSLGNDGLRLQSKLAQ